MREGGCHCGAVRYAIAGEPEHHALCHCTDCRRCAGATPVAWIAFRSAALTITRGEPKIYRSSPGAERRFCGDCGTGLFYFNEAVLPGLVDIQSATLDDAATLAPGAHIMTKDALPWEAEAATLPRFRSYPGLD